MEKFIVFYTFNFQCNNNLDSEAPLGIAHAFASHTHGLSYDFKDSDLQKNYLKSLANMSSKTQVTSSPKYYFFPSFLEKYFVLYLHY